MTTKNNSRHSTEVTNPKHDPDFLSQLPEWEHDYKTSAEQMIHYTPEQWKTAKAEFSVHDLRILGEAVMEDWEEPYMRVLAEIVTSRGGGHYFGNRVWNGYFCQVYPGCLCKAAYHYRRQS